MSPNRSTAMLHVTFPSELDTVAVRVHPADVPDVRKSGTFFLVLSVDEIQSLVPWTEPLAQFVEQTYLEAIALDPTASVERALGVARQRLKLKLQQLVQESRVITLDRVHYCFGVLRGKTLTLTHAGNSQAYVLHERLATSAAPAQTHWIHITEAQLGKGALKKPDLPNAPTIVSGAIGPTDTILISTSSVTDTLPLTKLEQIIKSPSLENSERLLDRMLRQTGSRVGFGAVLLRLPGTGTPTSADVTASMATLHSQESDTTSLLVSQGPSLISRLKDLPRAFKRPIRNAQEPLAERVGLETGSLVRFGFRATRKLFLYFILVPIGSVVKLFSTSGRQELKLSLERIFPKAADVLASRLNAWPRSTQRLLTFSLFLTYLFAQSLVFLSSRQLETAQSEAVTQKANEIQAALDQAESSLIFGNDAVAVERIAAAAMLLAELPRDSNTDEQRYAILESKRLELERRAAREVDATDLAPVATLTDSPLNPIAGLGWQNGQLFAYRADGASVGVIAPNNGEVTIITPNPASPLALTTELNQTTRVLSDGKTIHGLDTRSGETTQFASEAAIPPVSDIAAYNNRLYVLSATDRQVWRYQVSGVNLTNRTPWIKGNSPTIGDASSLTIDGDVYVVTAAGSVLKFTGGEQQAWRAAVTGGQQTRHLTTSQAYDTLFAVDVVTNEVYAWRKSDGKLIAQYRFPNVSRIADLAVSPNGQTVYVTDGQVIYRFSHSQ